MVVTADTLHKTQNVGPVAFHEAQFNFRTHNNHIWLAAVESQTLKYKPEGSVGRIYA